MSKRSVLDLDELFGRRQDLTVVWEGVRYPLLHPSAMGPEAVIRLGRMQTLRNDAIAAESAETLLAEATDALLALVSPELAAVDPPLPFIAKLRVLSFYEAQVFGEQSPNPVAGEKSTGATSTPA